MEKSKKVYEIFQKISPYYDKANDRISLGLQKSWKETLVKNMLRISKEKSKKINNITLLKADAKNIPYENSTFDYVTISFGLRNTDDYEKVINEMVRLGKKGIYILDSFPVENKIIKPFYKLFFKYLMPVLGGGIRRYKDYMWLYESTKNFISPNEIIKICERFGVENIEVKKMLFGACVMIKGQKL